MLKRWIKFCERPSFWRPYKNDAICSRHFKRNDYLAYHGKTRILHKYSIPTIMYLENGVSLQQFLLTKDFLLIFETIALMLLKNVLIIMETKRKYLLIIIIIICQLYQSRISNCVAVNNYHQHQYC